MAAFGHLRRLWGVQVAAGQKGCWETAAVAAVAPVTVLSLAPAAVAEAVAAAADATEPDVWLPGACGVVFLAVFRAPAIVAALAGAGSGVAAAAASFFCVTLLPLYIQSSIATKNLSPMV